MKKVMTIVYSGGNVAINGPEEDVNELRAKLKSKDNRHIFVEIPDSLISSNIDSLDVMPSKVAVIMIQKATNLSLPKRELFLSDGQN